jgi:xanthine dehydrogenase YagR molybdenum-binding subunit
MSQIVGKPLDRVDGPAKVTGRAIYAADERIPNVTYGALVKSTIARGRVVHVDTGPAEAAPGVLRVVTVRDGLRFANEPGPIHPFGQLFVPLQDDVIHHIGQDVAYVVAETLEQAHHAASLVDVEYAADPPAMVLADGSGERLPSMTVPPVARGDAARARARASVRVAGTFTSPMSHHNPIEPSTSIAVWDGDRLTMYETTQSVFFVRRCVAQMLGIPVENVRVINRFVGGAFGCKGYTFPHTYLTAAIARMVGRPVKLVLTRAQQYTAVGHRSECIQEVELGATRDGRLTAIVQHGTSQTSPVDTLDFNTIEGATGLYACPNVEVRAFVRRLNVGVSTPMRAPGSPADYALESSLDELSYRVGIDPVELRLRNYAEADPETGRPLPHKFLRECYHRAADRFGWRHRRRTIGSMRRGDVVVGQGMASSYHSYFIFPAAARARVTPDGHARVQSGTHDLGTGTYTIMTQIAADALGMPVEAVRFELGDTDLPAADLSASSSTAASVSFAVRRAGENARNQVIDLAISDPRSPLYRAVRDEVAVADGRLFLRRSPRRGETYQEILTRNRRTITADGATQDSEAPRFPGGHSFGAVFAEVEVSRVTGEVRLSRLVGAIDCGRVLNHKTARSQAIGGMIWGVGFALTEHTLIDRQLGRILTPNLSGYLVPVEADVPDLDVIFIDRPDPEGGGLGTRGMGEVAATGTAAAIGNAVYHATGRRVRDLPITPDKLL